MKRNFLNTKNIVIGLVSLVLIGASATGVTVFLKNRGEAEAAQEQVQNLPTTGNDNQEQNNSGTPAENPSDPEIPGTPVEPTTPGTTTPVEPTTPGSTTTRPSTGTTTPSREEISQGIEETVRIERQKVFEDLQLSWTTIGIPAITANMGIFKPELQIEKTVAAVVKAGESEQIPVTENNKPMVRAGDTVIYTIQVSNLGNYKATNVVVTDSLDVIFDGKTVPANQELAKIETLEAGKVATLKVGYVVKQADIDAVETNEQNETISKDIINIATATDGKTTVEDEDNMPVNPDVTINVNKNWQDNDNQDGKRPEKITVELYRNNENEPVETVTIDASSDWKYVFNNLPKYDENKNEITYRVVEVTVPEYDTKYEISDNGVEIYNHHTPETTEISGSKTWADSNNQDGKRPESIIVRLLANGKEVDHKKVTSANNWTWEFKDLPVYELGKKITYTISEDEVSGYTTTMNGYNITNSYKPETTEISGSKTWDDANNQDGKRPESITVRLLANGKEVANKEVKASDNWTWKFENLPVYELGKKITYTISEDEVSGYTTTMNGYNITNSYKPETTEISGSKTWDDANNQDGKRPESIIVRLLANGKEVDHKEVTSANNWTWEFKDLPVYELGKKITYTISEDEVSGYTTTMNGYNITNSYKPETTEISGSKTWDDANNQDGKRPESIIVRLLANGKEVDHKEVTSANNWTWEFKDLPVYELGKKITYTISEDEVSGYTTTMNGYNITNSYKPETTEISGSKTWDDANNQDGKRPDSITVRLLANGKEVANKEVKASDNWAWEFKDLPVYELGKKITYTISEDEVSGYTTTMNGYNITNSYEPEKTSISGRKTWVDLSSSTRPDSITVELFKTVDGTTTSMGDNYKRTLTGSKLDYSWSDLPVYEAGKRITYTVREVGEVNGKIDGKNGTKYEVEYDSTGLNITNTIAQELISISGSKIWIAPEGTEHPEIVIGIKQNKDVYYKDGKPYTITLPKNTQDSVDYTFTDLPRYTIENGKVTENEYEVYEVTDLADYNTRKQTLRLEDGTIKQNIVNTLKEIDAKVKFIATKNWVDEGTEATREDIKVNLYKNEDKKATATRTIATKGEPSCTFDNLPKYDVTTDSEGYVVSITENSYYVREEKAVEGYEDPQYSSVTSNSAKTEFYQTITNTIKQSTIDIPVEKIWNTAKGIVKPTIKFTLKMNGETYNKEDGTPYTITLENGTFTGTFTNLPKYKQANGKLVLEDGKVVRNEYTVVEEELSGYTSESKYENGKYTFTNTAKGIVKVTKHSSTATTDTVPVDVVLMLDVSGSMLNNNGKDKEPQSRAENMVSAVNSAISTIMAKNQNNRVSVVAFSSTNKDNNRKSYAYTNTIVLLPLAHYPTRNEYLSYSDDDDWDWEYTNYGKDWRYTKVNSAKISVIGTNKEISVTGGTYTQTGIYEGAMQLINTSDVTYTKGEGYDTVTRIPIMMLLTDGLPTYASTTWNGKPTNKADVKDNDNNPGANTTADEAYYTIRTAKHFKGEVGKHYKNTDAKFYTIGFGVDSSDKLANAILNPTATNINNCQGYGTAGSLYNKVMSNDQRTAGQYSYADGSYIGSMDTGTLTEIMNSFINANTKVTEERIMTEEELTGKIINLDNIDIEKEFKISYKTADGTKEYNFSEAKTAGLVKTDDKGATYYVDLNGVDITGQIIIAYNEKTVNS